MPFILPIFPIKHLLILYLLSGLFACGQNRTKTEEITAPVVPPRPVPALLNQEMAVDSLTAYGLAHAQDTLILIKTPIGDIKIRLFKDTPLHRANFVRLANYGFFDSTVFFRVEKDFMIQGGRSDFQTMSIGLYKIPAEVKPKYFHKRGAVGMARYGDDENPERMSSNRDFYIVQGQKLKQYEIDGYMKEFNLKLSPAQQATYRTEGGVPSLDQQYTVFGEVLEGMDVVDQIAAVEVDPVKWPLKDIGMTVRVISLAK